ncbi:MAG: cyclic nucleotide-binding domain-containing protein [Candidatus Omnitrophica bacterium]|nr:cyclic nucleotide-binding domain-containing protein [Candidatus Omnitrophota bacterium]
MHKTIPLEILKKYMPSLLRHQEFMNYRRGQIIFYKGHRAYGLYMVRSGKVGLFEKRDGTKNTIKRILGPGEIFGEEALASAEPYSVSAAAMEESRIVFFPKSVLNLAVHTKRSCGLKVKEAA